MQTSEMENEIRCYIKLEILKDALQILQSTYDEYEPKLLMDSIVSPYSRENETHFRIKVIDSYPGQILADVCEFCGTYCNSSLGLQLTSGPNRRVHIKHNLIVFIENA